MRSQILLILDKQPSHGYELRRILKHSVGDIEITKLYRWLREMEKEGLVESSKKAGPHGPSRRVYRMGPRGRRHLEETLGYALSIVLHFYDAFREYAIDEITKQNPAFEVEVATGPILVSVVSPLMLGDRGFVDIITKRTGKKRLHVLGETGIWEQKKTPFEKVEGTLQDIKCKNALFTEYWLLGIPLRSQLPSVLVEAKRVLGEKGILRLISPFAFFDEPETPSLEAFIRVTASHMFPELGVVEGQEICSVLKQVFAEHGTVNFHHGYVEFWGIR
ncbi:MAG: PadR family transcriptional regulator [Candidatus Thorarchaeota archaeon]|jgi:DNA-binding PadR family transcriptional regulator